MTIGYNIRVEKNIKNEAEKIFNSLGFTLSAAINAFLRASIKSKGFPFSLNLDNRIDKKILEAYFEAKRVALDPKHETFDSVDELMKSLSK